MDRSGSWRSLLLALAVSLALAWPASAQLIENGDFETGELTPWTDFTTLNGVIHPGYPLVTPFDTTGDGESSEAMKIRVGQIEFDPDVPAGGGIEQVFTVPQTGDYTATLNYAVALEQDLGNTAPGKFELLIDGVVLAVADHNGELIEPGQVIRGSLEGQADGLEGGEHTIQVRITRNAVDTREVYQYVDNVVLTGGGDPIPTVSEWGLIIMTLLLLTAGTIVFGRQRRSAAAAA